MIQENLEKVKKASHRLSTLNQEKVNEILLALADELVSQSNDILAENKKDLDRMNQEDPKYDRLLLNNDRLEGIAADIRKVSGLLCPLNKVLDEKALENGLNVKKISVPIGVVGIVYEARPNVTFDVFSLCFKSGNACVLKGGSDAEFSNKKIVQLIQSVLKKYQVDENVIYLAPAERESVGLILEATGLIDVIIPRGSQQLISYVRENAKVPVIETGAGIVHTYFDESGDIKKGKNIILNAKTRRVSVCNALDTLLIHEKRLSELAELVLPLLHHKVELFADQQAYNVLQHHYDDACLQLAKAEDFGKEFLDYKLSIKTVADLDEALSHINQYSSQHSEAIIAEDERVIQQFLKEVDAAAVYANTSTAFTDGAQFGLGAEIGISTQKLHARGPMALDELTSYKWVVRGNGQIRN